MKSSTISIEDTDENRQTCMKYCGTCPSYRKNSLGTHTPDSLFCARGISNAPEKREDRCFCLACDLFAS
ncbi:MAG TPA: DUF2769 domain-containing protein, partial [Methanoregula sp.]|nr:DUF2769 domain-containing protein [Methanoregula sp.]